MAEMVAFLTEAWVDALNDAAQRNDALQQACAALDLSVEQEVAGGPNGDFRYHVSFDHGSVQVAMGAAEKPGVRFSQDYETALSIAQGGISAQRAFMTGRLRVGGDLSAVVECVALFEQLSDVFGSVRTDLDA